MAVGQHKVFSAKNQPNTAAAAAAKSLQSCPTLCDPIGGSPPASAVAGILQTRTLEWVAIAFSKFMLDMTKKKPTKKQKNKKIPHIE